MIDILRNKNEKETPVFCLYTRNTSYVMQVLESGHMEHLHYGRWIQTQSIEGLTEQHVFAPGGTSVYSPEYNTFTFDDMRLEVSSYGKSDAREPMIELVHADGSQTSDFLYDSYEIIKGKTPLAPLPGSYGTEEEAETLKITLTDDSYNLKLHLYYYIFEEWDVITKQVVLENTSEDTVTIKRLLSNQLDYDPEDYVFTTFTGAWAREMHRNDIPVTMTKAVNASALGFSSNQHNPFVMISKRGITEDAGDCYGINLIYSGNHYEAIEQNAYGKVRFVSGINPTLFTWNLPAGESFTAPESVMTYSAKGYTGMSQKMQKFVQDHIVRGNWQYKERPILLNSWEAAYFDISESKLLKLAKAAKELGIELFVMDDGWFGERNDDTSSLGDWEPNPKKLPNGIEGIAGKVKKLGIDFGLWVEPEMVNKNSRLYEAHPDWAIQIPDKPHSEGRNQMLLDLTRTEVQDYIIEQMSKIFSCEDVSYIKWDMNRNFTDVYSSALPPEQQGEVLHRYMIGLYRIMDTLTTKFPDILFEGCASGGDRFDLGILSYFPQIWASDDTDAVCRTEIQTGYSYGYPLSTISAHVSDAPNHQTLRRTPLETRYNIAAFGVLGYECNLADLSKEDKEIIKTQVETYKQWRQVFQFGTFYRGRGYQDAHGISLNTNFTGNEVEWTVVSEDQTKAVTLHFQLLVHPNTQFTCVHPKGLNESTKYHFYNRDLQFSVKDFGSLVNYASPVHIKPEGVLQDVLDKVMKMKEIGEDFHMYGDVIMYGGVRLRPAFSSSGYNDQLRFYPDFASRMYFMEAEE